MEPNTLHDRIRSDQNYIN